MSNKFTFAAAIDPGKHTGIGIVSLTSKKLVHSTGSLTFWKAIDFMQTMFPDPSEVRVFIELPSRFVYGRNQDKEDKVRDNVLHKSGGTYRESELIKERLDELGYSTTHVAPVRRKGGGKWTQQEFRLHTGSNKQTNEHERDAVRLAYHYIDKEGLFYLAKEKT